MADMVIKDANGKEFTIDTAKVCDITGDFGVNNAASVNDATQHGTNRVAIVHNTKFVDSMGKEVNVQQLLTDMKNGSANVVAIDVDVEATHSGPNHNYCIYYEDSMEKDCESFVNPFRKPMLKNHNSRSGEPIGRIQSSSFSQSEIATDRSSINLKCRVTDQDAIPKFLDGRYGTVSIGGTMGTVTCNICGKTILKDGKFKFCGHWRGETYKDQVCYWGTKDIEYNEISVVNTPADDFAQVTKVTVLTDNKDDKNKGGSDNMDGNENTTTQDSTTQTPNNAADIKKTLSDMIDSLLGTSNTSQHGEQSASATQDSTTNSTAQQESNPPAQQQDNNTIDEGLKEQLDAANAKIKELETQLDALKQEKDKALSDANDARQEADNMKDMCLTLASANKNLIVDSIIAKECAANTLAQDKVADRKTELLSKSMKDINALSDSMKDNPQQPQQRQTTQVENPALADRTDDNGKQTQDTQQGQQNATDNKNARRNVDDYASEIIKKIYR